MYDEELWSIALDFAMDKIAAEFSPGELLTEKGYDRLSDKEKHRFRTQQVKYMAGMGALGGGLGTYIKGRPRTKDYGAIKVRRRLAGGRAIAVPATALAGGVLGGAVGLGLEGYAARRARKSEKKKR
jgi:hypothetical protein